ncbi:DUF488 domain-containing protein [Chitinophaga caeni]|uniref:DUF488 domain-containing protein n=1 Tax=Chitinophaga caeni TaxID=2029983 RepID=UPI001E398C78|nr:DUF488 family protein [Chitinophaga caeni]
MRSITPVIQLKRTYSSFDKTDGYRVLIDALWPRGISKEELHADQWLKTVAPSTELRKWFNHEPAKWQSFQRKYAAELSINESVQALIDIVRLHPVTTFLYSAHDEKHNNAIVLKEYIITKLEA